jgi:hypothetical protein
MLSSTGFILAAGGIEIANEALFAPLSQNKAAWTSLNWRLVPATVTLAIVIGGIEKLNAPFGKGLGMLVLLGVLIIPVGKAPTPLQNITKVVG